MISIIRSYLSPKLHQPEKRPVLSSELKSVIIGRLWSPSETSVPVYGRRTRKYSIYQKKPIFWWYAVMQWPGGHSSNKLETSSITKNMVAVKKDGSDWAIEKVSDFEEKKLIMGEYCVVCVASSSFFNTTSIGFTLGPWRYQFARAEKSIVWQYFLLQKPRVLKEKRLVSQEW